MRCAESYVVLQNNLLVCLAALRSSDKELDSQLMAAGGMQTSVSEAVACHTM